MKAEYTKNKGFDNKYYRDLVIAALKHHGTMTRKDLNTLLLDKLPEYMTSEQRINKVGNILGSLRKQGVILNTGSDHQPIWKLRKELRDKNN
ncbi:hypothetical protein J5690_06100 [bacterium]|nr:hypothetical protein [bacterium]